MGGHPIKEDAETIEQVAAIDGDFEFVTYMSLSCQNCPTVVQALNAMSVINPRIKHTAVEGSLFQDEIEEHGIKAVPTVYVNGELFDSGRMTMADILGRIDAGAVDRATEKLNGKEPYEVLVVGSGPAGAAASIYTARKGIRTGLVGERFGGQVLDTMAIENFVSVSYTEGPRFADALKEHVGQYDVDVVSGPAATELVPADTEGGYHTVKFGDASLQARSVVLATGARWRHMGVPGEEEYRNKGVTFCPHCDGPLFKGKRIAVIGGGNSTRCAPTRSCRTSCTACPTSTSSCPPGPPRSSATASRSRVCATRTARPARPRSCSSRGSSSRSACCPTPSGSRARSS